MIKVINIFYVFEKLFYNGVNLYIKFKESLVILGVSGSGKSMFLSYLVIMLKFNSGMISLLEY